MSKAQRRSHRGRPRRDGQRKRQSIPESDLPVATCAECGKKSYLSKRAAKADARRLFPGELMREYPCGRWWHLTSQSTEVTARQREYRRNTTT